MTVDVYTRHELPEHWEWRKLGDICSITDRDHRTPKYMENGIPLISPRDFTENGIDLSRLKSVDKSEHVAFVKKCKPAKGDILYSRIGTIGEARLQNFDFDFVALHSIALVKPTLKGLDPKYVLYLMQTPDVRSQAKHNIKSVGTPDLGLKRINNFDVPLAPPCERQRIVAEIEKQFSRLDEAVANLKRVKANLKRYKAAVLKAAVEGKLTENWRRQHRDVEPASKLLERILVERRKKWNGRGKYKEPISPDTNDLPSLPKDWTWATVEQLASGCLGAIQSGPFGSQLLHSEFVDDGILAIGIDNVLDGKFSLGRQHRITPAKFKTLEKFAARPRDVVITIMATVGRVCVLPQRLEPAIITKHCYRITPAPCNVDSEFLAIALRADDATRQHIFGNARGQTRPGINGPILKAAPVSLAPFDEQKEIVAEVDRRLSVIDELEAAVEGNLTRADRLRQSILQRAFCGELARG